MLFLDTPFNELEGKTLPRRIAGAALLLLAMCIPSQIFAQTAPEVLFNVGHLSGDCSTTPTMSLLSSGTRNDSGSWTSGAFTYTDSCSASAGSGSLSMTVGMTIDRASGSTGGAQCSGYGFEIYTKHPADMTLTGSGSASASFTNGAGGNISFGTYPINAGTYGLSQDNGPSGSTSGSGDQTVNLTCSTSAQTFSAYPGVSYYKAFQSNGQLYKVDGSVTLGGTGAASGTVSGSGSVGVSYATGTPVAKIGLSGAIVGYPVTLTNDSYDPDGPGGNQGTCTASWTISGPSGSITPSSSSNSSVTFTPSGGGPYTVNLTVTDNEGSQASTSLEFSPRDLSGPQPGIQGRTPEIVTSCGGPGNGGSGGGASGNPDGDRFETVANLISGTTGVRYHDPVKTRGYPLTLDVQINNQFILPTRTTAFANANFTYSIGVFYYQYYDGGGTMHRERWLVDGDGTAVYVGNWTDSPTLPSFFKSSLNSNATVLSNAGPPGRISYAGNYKYEFTTGGALYRITDPQGNIQETTYDSNGKLTTVTDLSTGKTLSFDYGGGSYVTRVTENGGETKIDFTYSSDRVTSIKVKDSSLAVMQQLDITYTTDGRINTVTKDGDSASTQTFSYYVQPAIGVSLGNISWNGGGTRINYFAPRGSGAWSRTEILDSNGNKTATDFDGNWLPIRTILPVMNGGTSAPTYTYTWNTSAKTLASVTDGATTTDFTYNSKGKVTEIDNNAGGVWTFTYASNGIDLTGISDSIGTVLTLVYGNSSLPHLPTSITGPDGNTWTKTYNSYGQVLTEVPPTGSPTGTTTFTYEENTSSSNLGLLKTVTNGAGNVTQLAGYTTLGDVTSIIQTPESGTDITTSFTYDGGQRVLSETLPDAKTRTYAYNYRKLASITDEAGNETAFSFCSICGKLTGIDMPLSKSLSWQEDGDQRTSGFTDARSNQTVYTYGNAGELKETTYPDSSKTIYRYDNYGRLREKEDTRGNKEQYAYDSAGRVETVTLVPYGGTSVDIDYTYNSDDTVATVTDEVGTTTYTYTTGRQISNVAYNWSASGLSTTQNVAYTYNVDGTLDTLTWKNGTTTVASWEYGYEGAGRVTSIDNNFSETTSFTYDGVGKLKTQTNDNGTSLTYAWNQQRGWPTQLLWKAGTTSFARYDIEYDGGDNTVGNISQVTELDSSVVEYTYDDLYRLTAETRTGTGSYTRSYGYDLAGNMTSYGGSTFASYDNTNMISSLSGGSISYDADGNTTAVSGAGISSTTFTWDIRNKLLRQQTSTDDLSYRYDHTGKRVLRWPTGTTGQKTFYVFSGETLIGEVYADSPSYAYTWGSTGLVSQRAIGSSLSVWYHFGPQQETRQLTDGTGATVDSYRYDGFGRPTYSSGTTFNPFRYGGDVGYYAESAVGMMLATNRWFSPQLARWTNRDPIEYDGSDNLYSYAESNPILYGDWDGLDVKEWGLDAIVGFGDAVAPFGLTKKIRSYLDPEGDPVNDNTPAYVIGGVAGSVTQGSICMGYVLRGASTLSKARAFRWLNRNRKFRVGPGRMPANGRLPAGPKVPRISIGNRPKGPHLDIRVWPFD